MFKVRDLCLAVLVSFVLTSWSIDAEEPQQSTVRRVVTGTSERLPTSDVDLLRIRFEPGSRTYWHTHQSAQIYLVEVGRGRFQVQGREIREVGPGEPVYMPPNVPHWHGAAPAEPATCFHAYPGGVAITILEEVTEQEYMGQVVTTR